MKRKVIAGLVATMVLAMAETAIADCENVVTGFQEIAHYGHSGDAFNKSGKHRPDGYDRQPGRPKTPGHQPGRNEEPWHKPDRHKDTKPHAGEAPRY